MKKKLKIKFWKTERALAMQIVEQEGLPKEKTGTVVIKQSPKLYSDVICLRGDYQDYDLDIEVRDKFESNAERDTYLYKITQAITDELFTSDGKLKVGEMCEVSNNEVGWGPNELLAILPESCEFRYIVKTIDRKGWNSFIHARPLCKRTEPKVETNGEIITYTWEE